MKLASNMLETYDRQILSIESSLMEAEEGLETQRQLWHMQLDSSRNHIILFNMYLSMASISIMAATLVRRWARRLGRACLLRPTALTRPAPVRARRPPPPHTFLPPLPPPHPPTHPQVPAFFGMNLETGMGESAPVFYIVVGLSVGIMVTSFPLVQRLYHSQYRRVVHHELADFKTLRWGPGTGAGAGGGRPGWRAAGGRVQGAGGAC
jgi:hypothetical protein